MLRSLRAFLAGLRSRLHGRPDSEHEQALVRLGVTGAILFYLALADRFGAGSTREPLLVYTLIGLFLVAAVAIFVEICRRPEASPRRRYLAMVADNAAITTCMHLTTELGAPLFGVFLFVTFGYGFRYGRQYLFASQAMSLVGFVAVLWLNPYWHEQIALGLGLVFSMVVLPAYVATLLKRIHKAREAAEAANLEKTRFLSTMSHEMRTPLNGVIGINELLFATALNAEQRELLQSSQSSAQHLLSLVTNILDISRIEAGRLELERVEYDLHRLLHTTLRTLQLQADQKKLELQLNVGAEVPYQLVGSPVHLRQVLVNLAGNAIKFTETGMVSIRAMLTGGDPAAERLRFEVQDTGIGIAAEALPRIFERFFQADQSITRVYGGSGLGTAISKQLVELMGGSIGARSAPGEGSLFWFEIPCERATAPAVPLSIPGLRANLLLTDATEAAALSASLTAWGVQVEVSSSGPALLRAVADAFRENRPVQLALVDARALKVDPLQLAASVRAERGSLAPMLVLLNADVAGRPRAALQRAGFASFLDSPVDKSQLFNVVHSVVARGAQPVSESVIPISAGARVRRGSIVRSVLVAEDNPTNRLVIQKILEGAGHLVTMVDNGEQVLDALENARFDCVIVDWHMPVMGGLEALKLYRVMEPRGSHTPFVMFTANATKEAMEECRTAGFDGFLTKPIEPKRLLDVLASVCSDQQAVSKRPMLVPEAPPATQPESASTQLVDHETLSELEAIGRAGFVSDLIAGFNADGEKLIAAMRTSVRSADLKSFREHVHALKGSAGSLGAQSLYEKCRAVSQTAPRDLPGKAEKLLADIETSFGATREALSDYAAKRRRAAG